MPHTDSAGIPFEGRAFQPNAAAGDDGSADAGLLEALTRFRAGEAGMPEVVAALGPARLLVPLVAEAGDEGIGPHGQRVDKTQELALVTVEGPDGRPVLPAFSSVDAMRAWNPVARPIPVVAPRAALAAAADGVAALVLDPGSPTEFVLRRTGFEALATGAAFLPCFADERVLAEFVAAAAGESAVVGVQLAPGDPHARFAGPELVVRLALDAGLSRADLDGVVARLGDAWSRSALIAERVDSIAVRLESA